MVQFQSPKFCSKCSYLALAELDELPLCLSCLQGILKTSSDPYIVYRISPLEIPQSEIRGLTKSNPYSPLALDFDGDLVLEMG